MRFSDTEIPGLVRVRLNALADERGFFARLHCEQAFAQRGLAARMVQTSLSRTDRRGTVRGFLFQWPPETWRAAGQTVNVSFNGTSGEAVVKLDESISEEVALVPRSMGIPIREPVLVKVKP